MKKSEPHPSVPPGAGGGDPLEELFDQARGERLGAGEMSALWARVSAASLGATAPKGGSGAAGGGASTTAATAAGAGLKTVAVLLVGGGLLGAVAAGSHFWQASPRVQVASAPVQAPAPAQAGPADPASIGARPDPSPLAAVEVSALPSVNGHGRAGAKPRPAIAADPRDPAKATAAPRTAGPEATETAGVASESASPAIAGSGPTAGTRVAAPAQGARPQQDDTSTANPTPEAAPTEAALLLRARRALGSDPAAALALTDEHARRYPSGTLVPEREVLAIEALARLGRSSDARRRLDALRERFPNAANVSRLDGLIGK